MHELPTPIAVRLMDPFDGPDGVEGTLTFARDGFVNFAPMVAGYVAEQKLRGNGHRNHDQNVRRRVVAAARKWVDETGCEPHERITVLSSAANGSVRFHPILLRYLLQPHTSSNTGIAPDRDGSNAPDPNAEARRAIPHLCAYCASRGSRVHFDAVALDAMDDADVPLREPANGRRLRLPDDDRAILDEAADENGVIDMLRFGEAHFQSDIVFEVADEQLRGPEYERLERVRAAFRAAEAEGATLQAVPMHVAELIVAYARGYDEVYEPLQTCAADRVSDPVPAPAPEPDPGRGTSKNTTTDIVARLDALERVMCQRFAAIDAALASIAL